MLSFLCPTPFRSFSLITTLSQMRCDDIEFEGVFIDPNVRPYLLIRKMVKIAFSLIQFLRSRTRQNFIHALIKSSADFSTEKFARDGSIMT